MMSSGEESDIWNAERTGTEVIQKTHATCSRVSANRAGLLLEQDDRSHIELERDRRSTTL